MQLVWESPGDQEAVEAAITRGCGCEEYQGAPDLEGNPLHKALAIDATLFWWEEVDHVEVRVNRIECQWCGKAIEP